MIRKKFFALVACVVLLTAYLLSWPVAIEPVAWDAPKNKGYVGAFAVNDGLASIERISLGSYSGPEDAAFGSDGNLYISTHEGFILRYNPDTGVLEEFANTEGRPLGIEFAQDGILYVADAYRGLLSISPTGAVSLLADKTQDGSPIHYADDLDIATDGSVYFTDASTKFGAKQFGGTFPASVLDLMEHGSNGRVLRYDPVTKSTETVHEGFNFANGLAMAGDGEHYLVVDTGTYSVKKLAFDGSKEPQMILDNLPGFPDNINRNADGTFWLGLVSPRSELADNMSNSPWLRKMVMRLPAFMRPTAQRHGFVIKINDRGDVLETLQDPTGAYALTTGLIEGPDGKRYITSLTEPDIAVIQ